MKYTNIHGLPDIVERWLTHDEYDYHPGVYSATRLMKPTRMVVLEKRHEDELECDITDVIAPRYGTALHDSFEKIELPNCIQEQRFFAELDGHKLSGKPDILEIEGEIFLLWDIKSTSVWTHIYKSRAEDYRIQLSIYRWLVMNGEPEEDLGEILHPDVVSRQGKIIYMFTDWAKSRAKQGGDYPPIRVMVEDVEMMSTEDTETYILGRLGAIHHYLDNPSESLPRCTNEELWRRVLVMKKGRKTPVKKFNTMEQAENWLQQNATDEETTNEVFSLEYDVVNRCNYCLATKWCDQFKEVQGLGILAEG